VFVLPGEEMPLHIFEPRYKQLINDVRALGLSFGIPFVMGKKLSEWGCEVELKQLTQVYPNGSMDIVVKGKKVFHMRSFLDRMDGKLYSGGKVEFKHLEDKNASDGLLKEFTNAQIKVFGQSEAYSYAKNFSVNEVASQSQLTAEQKVRFIAFSDVAQREAFLINQLKLLILLKKQEESLEYNFYLN